MFETELEVVQKATFYSFRSNNQVLFDPRNQKACQVNLPLIGARLYLQNLISNPGCLLPLMSNCYHNQTPDYLYFHIYFGICFDQYQESICQVYE